MFAEVFTQDHRPAGMYELSRRALPNPAEDITARMVATETPIIKGNKQLPLFERSDSSHECYPMPRPQ